MKQYAQTSMPSTIANPQKHASLDFYYGPYDSLDEAKGSAALNNAKDVGLTIGVLDSSSKAKIKEYWWNESDWKLKTNSPEEIDNKIAALDVNNNNTTKTTYVYNVSLTDGLISLSTQAADAKIDSACNKTNTSTTISQNIPTSKAVADYVAWYLGGVAGAMVYKGSTNTAPSTTNAEKGWTYLVSAAHGSALVGDMYVFNGTKYDLIPSANTPVTSKDATIGTDLTDIAVVEGVTLKAKIDPYKPIQTAKNSPNASGNEINFIDTVSLDKNGVITATKKTVRTGSASQSGVVPTATKNYFLHCNNSTGALEWVANPNSNTTYKLTLNGTTKGDSTSGVDLGSFYAPTGLAGTGGYILATNSGKTALEWVAKPVNTDSKVNLATSTGTVYLVGHTSNAAVTTGTTLQVQGCYANNGALYASSDARLKNLIKTHQLSLDEIVQIPTILFTWKNGDDNILYGTIAQEVQKICPEIVNTNEDGLLSVSYDKFGLLAIEAIKELKKEIEELKTPWYTKLWRFITK